MASRGSVTAPSAARDRGLERALIANLLVHALAMLGMALFLLAALPGGSPLAGTVSSTAARAIAGPRDPLCFHVASVSFTFSRELHDPR